eukprot:gene10478-3000_t
MSKLKQRQNINKKPPPKIIKKDDKNSTEKNDPNDNFEVELKWCIDQLLLGQKRKDADETQIKESQAVVNKLKSTKNTKAEKRFIMTRTFGDYRKYIKEFEQDEIKKKEEEERKRLKKERKKLRKLEEQKEAEQAKVEDKIEEKVDTLEEKPVGYFDLPD